MELVTSKITSSRYLTNIKNRLDNFIETKNIPNMIICGPYNSGKEIIYKYFIYKLYPTKKEQNKYVLFINCLTTNGIKIIKDTINLFSKLVVHKSEEIYFKTIIIINSDYLTFDTQYSLRQTIEKYSNNTRFILVCTSKDKLLQPISSRFVNIYINNSGNTGELCYKLVNATQPVKIKSIIDKYNNICNSSENILLDLMNLSHEVYNEHVFTLELLPKFKKYKQYQLIKTYIYFVSKQFRNEVMSLFYLFCMFRKNKSIPVSIIY